MVRPFTPKSIAAILSSLTRIIGQIDASNNLSDELKNSVKRKIVEIMQELQREMVK